MAQHLNIVLVGNDLQAKCVIGNALVRQSKAFRTLCTRTKPLAKKLPGQTIAGFPLLCLVTPNLNTPGWVYCIERINAYNIKVFVYVQVDDDNEDVRYYLKQQFPGSNVITTFYDKNNKLSSNDVSCVFVNSQWSGDKKRKVVLKVLHEIEKVFNKSIKPSILRPNMCVVTETPAVCGAENSPNDQIPTENPDNKTGSSKQEIKQFELGDTDWELYELTLKLGTSRSNHIRVNVVGNQGMGKTTLVHRLQRIHTECPTYQPPTEALEVAEITSRCTEDDSDNLIWETNVNGYVEELNYRNMAEAMSKLARAVDFKKSVLANPSIRKEYSFSTSCTSDLIDEEDMSFPIVASPTNRQEREHYLKQVIRARIENARSVYVSFWDFAGQTTYHSTHQTFLTRKAVYLLLFDLSKSLDSIVNDTLEFRTGSMRNCTVKESLLFWATSIKTYTLDSRGGRAPIILVGTHADKVSDEIGTQKLREAKQILGLQINYIKIDNTLPVDPTQMQSTDPKDLRDLRKMILELGLAIVDEKVPARWIDLEYALQQRKSHDTSVMTFKEVQDLNAKMYLPLEDVENLEIFLEHLHCRGQILFFPEKELRDLIILKPMNLAMFLNALMRDSNQIQQTASNIDVINQDGIISTNYVEEAAVAILETEEMRENAHLLLKMLIHLKIILPYSSADTRTYIMPCMLPDKPKGELNKSSAHYKQIPRLQVAFKESQMPPGFYHIFIPTLIQKVDDLNIRRVDGKLQLYFHYAGLYLINDTIKCDVMWNRSTILIDIKNFSRKYKMNGKLVKELIENIECAVQSTLNIYSSSSIQYNVGIECPNEHQEERRQFIPFQKLLEEREYLCDEHVTSIEEVIEVDDDILEKHDPRLDEIVTEKQLGRLASHLNENTQALAKTVTLFHALKEADRANSDFLYPNRKRLRILTIWKQQTKHPTLKELIRLLTLTKDYKRDGLTNVALYTVQDVQKDLPNETLDRQLADMDGVAQYIGKDYPFLMLELGLSLTTIEHAECDYRGDEREITKQLLHTWMAESPENSTIRCLLNTMSFLKFDTTDITDKLKLRYSL